MANGVVNRPKRTSRIRGSVLYLRDRSGGGVPPAPPIPPNITTVNLPDATVDEYYQVTIMASGTWPRSWTITSGSLPDGLTLSSGGIISGTSTEDGSFSFTVQVTNAAGSDTASFTLTVTVPLVLFCLNTLPAIVGASYIWMDSEFWDDSLFWVE